MRAIPQAIAGRMGHQARTNFKNKTARPMDAPFVVSDIGKLIPTRWFPVVWM